MIKQVIVIRKDLKMRWGKEIVQAYHAIIKAIFLAINDLDECSWCIRDNKIVFEDDSSILAEWYLDFLRV